MHDVADVSFASNLVGFWPLTSETREADLSSNGNHLSVAGAPTYPSIGEDS